MPDQGVRKRFVDPAMVGYDAWIRKDRTGMTRDDDDFLDAEAYLSGDVSPALICATLRAEGYDVVVSGHSEAQTSLKVHLAFEAWTSVAIHFASEGSRGKTETLLVADNSRDGPEILATLANQFGGRWRRSCGNDVPFTEMRETQSIVFSPSDLLMDKLSKIVSPLAAHLIGEAVEKRPEAAEEIAEAIRENCAFQGPVL